MFCFSFKAVLINIFHISDGSNDFVQCKRCCWYSGIYANRSQGVDKLFHIFFQDRKLDVENALKMAAADDGFVTYSELRENLKHSNFSDMEIDLFFDMFK